MCAVDSALCGREGPAGGARWLQRPASSPPPPSPVRFSHGLPLPRASTAAAEHHPLFTDPNLCALPLSASAWWPSTAARGWRQEKSPRPTSLMTGPRRCLRPQRQRRAGRWSRALEGRDPPHPSLVRHSVVWGTAAVEARSGRTLRPACLDALPWAAGTVWTLASACIQVSTCRLFFPLRTEVVTPAPTGVSGQSMPESSGAGDSSSGQQGGSSAGMIAGIAAGAAGVAALAAAAGFVVLRRRRRRRQGGDKLLPGFALQERPSSEGFKELTPRSGSDGSVGGGGAATKPAQRPGQQLSAVVVPTSPVPRAGWGTAVAPVGSGVCSKGWGGMGQGEQRRERWEVASCCLHSVMCCPTQPASQPPSNLRCYTHRLLPPGPPHSALPCRSGGLGAEQPQQGGLPRAAAALPPRAQRPHQVSQRPKRGEQPRQPNV